jgi:biopolymer transport protein ExbD
MARKPVWSSLTRISDIQLTSMMDLSFLLLVTFIITFPLIEQGIPVNLPRGTGESVKSQEARTITVDKDGRTFLDDVAISKEQLRATMVDLGSKDPETTVMLRADEALRYGSVVEVLRILHDAKIARMALVTQSDDTPKP